MAFTSGCSISASTASLSPCTTLNTPWGSPACCSRSAINRLALGSVGLGLRMKVLPAAMATGNIHIGTMTGKLNGVIPATTPSGWRSVQLSMPVLTWSVKSPFSSCGMPHANSMMSMPRDTSPCASVNTLPCSAVIRWANLSLCWFTSSRNLNNTRARRIGGVSAQAGNAACAAATAWPTSVALANATRPVTAPVAGLKTSCVRPELPATTWPLMKWSIFAVLMVFSPCNTPSVAKGRALCQ